VEILEKQVKSNNVVEKTLHSNAFYAVILSLRIKK